MGLDLALLDMDLELVRLAGVIPWDRLGEEFGPLYCDDNGQPTEDPGQSQASLSRYLAG